jgi:hypothetical protein
MRELLAAAGTAGPRDSVLLILLGVVFALWVLTVLLSVYAIVLRRHHLRRERRREALAERWRGPLLLALADSDGGTDVGLLVDEKDRLRFVGYVLEFARRVRGEERRVLRDLARPHLELVAQRARYRQEEVRARAIQTLGTLGLPDYAPLVVGALDDTSPLVAMVAARALAREETPEYALEVLARLERFKGWDRRFLASMLAAMGPEVAATIRSGLEDTANDPWVRALLAEAAYLQGDFLAADPAARVLRESRDRELRVSALRLLGGVGRPEHASMIRDLCRSEDATIRAQALAALVTVGGREDLPVFLEAIEDPYPWAALYAARGVAASGGVDALARLGESDHPRAALARQVLAEGVA